MLGDAGETSNCWFSACYMLYARRNTSSYTWHPIQGTKVSGEDPMLWLDQAEEDGTEVLHAVLHGGGWSDPFGHHYWYVCLVHCKPAFV
jgi:hypothetical protein